MNPAPKGNKAIMDLIAQTETKSFAFSKNPPRGSRRNKLAPIKSPVAIRRKENGRLEGWLDELVVCPSNPALGNVAEEIGREAMEVYREEHRLEMQSLKVDLKYLHNSATHFVGFPKQLLASVEHCIARSHHLDILWNCAQQVMHLVLTNYEQDRARMVGIEKMAKEELSRVESAEAKETDNEKTYHHNAHILHLAREDAISESSIEARSFGTMQTMDKDDLERMRKRVRGNQPSRVDLQLRELYEAMVDRPGGLDLQSLEVDGSRQKQKSLLSGTSMVDQEEANEAECEDTSSVDALVEQERVLQDKIKESAKLLRVLAEENPLAFEELLEQVSPAVREIVLDAQLGMVSSSERVAMIKNLAVDMTENESCAIATLYFQKLGAPLQEQVLMSFFTGSKIKTSGQISALLECVLALGPGDAEEFYNLLASKFGGTDKQGQGSSALMRQGSLKRQATLNRQAVERLVEKKRAICISKALQTDESYKPQSGEPTDPALVSAAQKDVLSKNTAEEKAVLVAQTEDLIQDALLSSSSAGNAEERELLKQEKRLRKQARKFARRRTRIAKKRAREESNSNLPTDSGTSGDELSIFSDNSSLVTSDRENDIHQSVVRNSTICSITFENTDLLESTDVVSANITFVPKTKMKKSQKVWKRKALPWAKYLKKAPKNKYVREIHPDTLSAKLIGEMYHKKMIADKDLSGSGKRQSLCHCVLHYFTQKYGLRKMSEESIYGVVKTIRGAKNSARIALFGTMCGVLEQFKYAPSIADVVLEVLGLIVPAEKVPAFLDDGENNCYVPTLEALKAVREVLVDESPSKGLEAPAKNQSTIMRTWVLPAQFKRKLVKLIESESVEASTLSKEKVKDHGGSTHVVNLDTVLNLVKDAHLEKLDLDRLMMMELFGIFDANNDGVLSFEEFSNLINTLQPVPRLNEYELHELWENANIADEDDDDDSITKEAFAHVCISKGLQLPYWELPSLDKSLQEQVEGILAYSKKKSESESESESADNAKIKN